MEWFASFVVMLLVTHAAAEPAKRVLDHQPVKLNNRFAYRGKLGFVDDQRYVAVVECDDKTKAAKIISGRVASKEAPRTLATLAGCEAVVGDGVVVEKHDGYIHRYSSTDGRALKKIDAAAGDLMVLRILAANSTTVVTDAWRNVDGPTREAVIAVFVEGRAKPQVVTTPELISLAQQAVTAALDGQGNVWVSTTNGYADSRLHVWNIATAKLRVIKTNRCTLLWLVAGGEIACATRTTGGTTTISRIDAKGPPRWTYVVDETVDAPASTNRDRSRVVVPTSTTFVIVASDGKPTIVDMPGDPKKRHVTELAMSPDGKHVLAGTSDGRIELWSLPP